jgi:hypothetical protein
LALEATPVGSLTLTDDSLFVFLENRSERSGYIVSAGPQLKAEHWKQKSTPDWHLNALKFGKGSCWREIVVGACRFPCFNGAPEWRMNLKGCIRSIGSSDDMLFVGVQEGVVYALRY